ncbi:hypothetical protein [Pedobacter sp. MC2016-24]|uniref:hypothetical protein n=1 Tax=Pedobacter sp. MC2016-24 TaxID=2780090 RepID=UPI0018815337|nr:hypothetical protein [Pedobacter sp. MC2016-24]MBE9597970.1 hypothetical protein [Pedobacter sp. MC2016-24]
MNAEELRLGNIVNFLMGSSWLQGQVNNIGKSNCVIGASSIKSLNIQGVRITEEWLRKFGFREMEDTIPEGYPTFWPPDCSRFRIYFSESNQMFNWDVFDLKTLDLMERIATINYVHQLQNLFFMLEGKELVVQEV